jgi:hypothetical protein
MLIQSCFVSVALETDTTSSLNDVEWFKLGNQTRQMVTLNGAVMFSSNIGISIVFRYCICISLCVCA